MRPMAKNRMEGTTKNIDHVIEADATISLFGSFEESLDFIMLVFGENAPLFVHKFFKVLPTSPSHLKTLNIFQLF